MEELYVVINHIIADLMKDNINMEDVTIVVEFGEVFQDIMENLKDSTWPSVIHARSFMGQESPVVIWLTSANCPNRQVFIIYGL